MGTSPEELEKLARLEALREDIEDAKDAASGGRGGYVGPYTSDEYPVDTPIPSRPLEQNVTPPKNRSKKSSGTVPSSESKVLRILGVADDTVVHETLLEPTEVIDRVQALKEEIRRKKLLGGQAVQKSVDSHPSDEASPGVSGEARLVDPSELARELGVPVTVKKDSFGNRVIIPLFPEENYKKNK
ncbi:MAG TPA: hypothetical protein PJ984_02710 [Candidatus Saccharibacteria bacterium]|nr:hypothetical protein [Candidatus Saccharibacteria bacterium]